jgi:tetratricopeptide (TPR) repeat protein
VAQNALGFDKEAQASWARALELNPQFMVARIALADAAANHRDYDEALRLTAEILKTRPMLTAAQITRARALIGKGSVKEAENILQAILDRDPASLSALSVLVNLRVQEGHAQSLIPLISKGIREQSQNAGLYYWLGVAHFSSKEFGPAEQAARHAITLNPKRWEVYRLLARIHVAEGATDQARSDLESEIKQNQDGVEGYTALENLSEQEGKWEAARRFGEKAHQLDPADPVIANNLAYIYLEHGGDINYAVSLAREARRKAPEAPYAADTLGWAYYKLGSTEAAVAQLAEAVQRVPGSPEYQYHLGMAYGAAGRPSQARQSLERALAIDPHFPGAASALAALDHVSKQQSVAKK